MLLIKPLLHVLNLVPQVRRLHLHSSVSRNAARYSGVIVGLWFVEIFLINWEDLHLVALV